jgi:RNA polymerase-binding transcription factor DksA
MAREHDTEFSLLRRMVAATEYEIRAIEGVERFGECCHCGCTICLKENQACPACHRFWQAPTPPGT